MSVRLSGNDGADAKPYKEHAVLRAVDARLRYSMLIEWSEEDAAYLVTLPEWEGRVFHPVAHGDTDESAVRNGRIALQDLVALSQEQGMTLPEPRVALLTA